MPPTAASQLRVGRYFLSLLAIFAVLYGLVFLPGRAHRPKLGLDLEGGAQVVFRAKVPGGGTPSQASMKIARQILTDRVNGAGVSSAEVVQQGSDRIVVSVPGARADKLEGVGAAAELNFRPVAMPAVAGAATAPATGTSGATGTATPTAGATNRPTGSATSTATPSATATSGATGASSSANGIVAPQAAAPTTAASTPAATGGALANTSPAAAASDPFKALGFPLPKSEAEFDKLSQAQQQALTAALTKFDCSSRPVDVATQPLAACDPVSGLKYLLGPVIVPGREIKTAAAVPPSGQDPAWTVSIDLKSAGQKSWANYTNAHHSANNSVGVTQCGASTTPCAEFVAFTLDGNVVSSPHNEATINSTTSVSGTFTADSANKLANQLKYGALPLSFTQETATDLSPTLGTSQLKAGLLAGGIGLVLVVLYSLVYYRALGFVTIASLLVSGGLTYACLVILGREIGFTLTLAGIAGFVIAIGITADSFIVFFERIKDEVHGGRSVRVAVPRAWARARRTIVSADVVSLLAAAVLYYFAAGEVRGFAFTLGLSTVLDLAVVFLFTHPLVSLLSRSRAFGSPRFTGLNSVRRGGIVPSPAEPEPVTTPPAAGPARSAGRRGATPPTVALLEPDTGIDADTDTDTDTDTDAAVRPGARPVSSGRRGDRGRGSSASALPTAAAPDEEPAGFDGPRAPRRSRVSPRAARAQIGLDAAERAASRRGRQTRTDAAAGPDVGDAGPDVGDAVLEADDLSPNRRDGHALDGNALDGTALDATPARNETPDVTAGESHSAPPPPAAPRPTSSAIGTTAAERAAARRRRARPADEISPAPVAESRSSVAEPPVAEPAVAPLDEPVFGRPGSTASALDHVEAAPTPEPAVAPEPVTPTRVDAPQAHPAGPVEMPADEVQPRVVLTPAAARAEARRARIRAKAEEIDS